MCEVLIFLICFLLLCSLNIVNSSGAAALPADECDAVGSATAFVTFFVFSFVSLL
jgi:hypothetical protein